MPHIITTVDNVHTGAEVGAIEWSVVRDVFNGNYTVDYVQKGDVTIVPRAMHGRVVPFMTHMRKFELSINARVGRTNLKNTRLNGIVEGRDSLRLDDYAAIGMVASGEDYSERDVSLARMGLYTLSLANDMNFDIVPVWAFKKTELLASDEVKREVSGTIQTDGVTTARVPIAVKVEDMSDDYVAFLMKHTITGKSPLDTLSIARSILSKGKLTPESVNACMARRFNLEVDTYLHAEEIMQAFVDEPLKAAKYIVQLADM